MKRSVPIDLFEESGVTTDSRYGSNPDERPLEELLRTGLIIIDKPRGPSSHEVVAWTKQILHLEKAGHSGTLDPKVTGVLPIALESGTKVIKQLLDMGKAYVCLMRLHKEVSPEEIREALTLFTGKIYQRPPVKSAVKRQVRVREIYGIKLIDIVGQFVLFRVDCQAGTYIRKLVYDIGMVLGTGANMVELRRSRVASLGESDTITLQQLTDAYNAWEQCGDESLIRSVVHPIEFAVSHLPKMWIRDSAIDAICHGANLATPGLLRVDNGVKKGEKVAIISLKGELVAVAVARFGTKKLQKMESGFVADTIRVVMEPGTYPRTWKSSN